ncbi:MAG: CDP-glycerol glycerophosphotransferase family protein [Ruminococcus sp.]|nr:CDP-glycerol glycerophosphotransferase family protein [Ruminococcus sp.]
MTEKGAIKEQTWADFDHGISGKHIFLFGTGAGADYFFRKYKDKYFITGILDNDERWHGFVAGDIFAEAFESPNEKTKIMPVSVLDDYEKEECVVLITSTKYYKAMEEQLLAMNVSGYYVLLMLEANQRKQCSDICEDINLDIMKKEYVDDCCKRPIQLDKIVFKSFDTYSDHGKYITEQLLKGGKRLDIVWVLKDLREKVPAGVRTVWAGNWKKSIYEMETAHIWVINTLMPPDIIKREGQIYIHTKHWASITLKKFYLDASTITDVSEDVERWRHNGQCIDYVLTGSSFDTESFRRGFAFQKEAVQIGSPRTDAMFWPEECRRKVTAKYHLDQKHKFLLYAPTYRYNRERQGIHEAEVRNIGLDYNLIRNVLETKFGGKWDILLRLHPSVAAESRRFVSNACVVDVSAYPDSEELASACDIMISDYSSIMFEPAFVKKPVFLFATDKKEYIDHEYDFLLDYEALPFSIAETNEELVKNIMAFDQSLYENRVMDFLEYYGVREDGHASRRAAEFILGLVGGNIRSTQNEGEIGE